MLRILKSPEAENDLDEIWLYIAQDNPDCADKLPLIYSLPDLSRVKG